VCRSFDHFITNCLLLVCNNSLIYERQVDRTLSSLPAHDKLHRLRRQGAAWRGEAPSGFKAVIPVTRLASIYELNCGLFALGNVVRFKHQARFLRLTSVLAERKPNGCRLIRGLRLLTSHGP